jgi:hypothetical protein
MEGNVPKLIVRDIFRNIPRFYRDIEKKGSSQELIHRPPMWDASALSTRPSKLNNIGEIEQYLIGKQFLR